MANYTDVQVREFINQNLNRNTFNILTKLLNMETTRFQRLLDLLIGNRITIGDINAIGVLTDVKVDDFLKSRELEMMAYKKNPASTIYGLDYILNTLGVSELLSQGVNNTIVHNRKNLYEYIPSISVGAYDKVASYKSIDAFRTAFNANIYPLLLEQFGSVSSLEEVFPIKRNSEVADPLLSPTIDKLFDGVSSVYTSYDSQGVATQKQTKDLGISIYESIFSPIYKSTNYLSQDDIIFLLFRINDKIPKLESNSVIFDDILNNLVPSEEIKNFVNRTAMDIENRDHYLTDLEVAQTLISKVESLNFSTKLNYSLNEFTFIDFTVKKYYEQNNNLAAYNQGMKDVLDIILDQVRKFETLILYSRELANRYLLTL